MYSMRRVMMENVKKKKEEEKERKLTGEKMCDRP